MKYYTIFFLQLIFFHNVSSCWFATNNERMTCSSVVELSAEGNNTWKRLYLFRKNAALHLKNNTFKRTPNLEDVVVANIASLEEGSFNGLNNLDVISIFMSELEEIPLSVFDNLPIRNFQLSKTKVKKIQPGLFNHLPDIRQVDLRNNKINEIQKGVFDNTPIYKLYLGNNGIDKIHDRAFENMSDLLYLSLHGNLINSFNTERYIGTSTSLAQLWLNINKLTKITKDMFTTVPNLTYLYLELNQITSIESESFHHIPLLEFLDISNNKLQEIQPNVFLPSGMKNLYYISLLNNHLSFVDKEFFARMPGLKYVTYGGNPFQCPCSQQIDNLMKEKNISRVCDKDYTKGERPSCVFTSTRTKECLYNVDYNQELYDLFHKALEEYPKLEQKCDTTKGIANGFLNNAEKV